MPTNKELIEQGNEALSSRTDYEKKLAQNPIQRFCMDRGQVNNNPWPRASNIRYPLSDTLIDQKKPFLFKLIYASETIAHFKAMLASNVQFASQAEKYFDFVIRELTDFEEEIQYATDGILQDGACYLKTTWDVDRQVPVFEFIEPMFIITPSGTQRIQDAEWVYHVLQYTPKQVRDRFKDAKGIEEFIKKFQNNTFSKADAFNREEDEYRREGINTSGTKDFKMIVLWECHYTDDEGNKRLRVISPDDEAQEFSDTAYPYEYPESYRVKWMIEQGRREYTKKKLYSSRGIPEIVQEGEYSLTAMWRSKHNAMTLYNNPFFATNGAPPGSTQNVQLKPGTLVPFQLQAVQLGQPPISWDVEMNQTRGVWEKRASAPDFGRTDKEGNNRTAREVSLIAGQQSLSVELEAGNWKMFLRKVLRQAWALIIQHKPKSLAYYVENSMQELTTEALNPDYSIVLSGSAEALNRELDLQKADLLWQKAVNNPFANQAEAWKNFLQVFKPGEVQRFYQDPAQRQQSAIKKAASDLSLIVTMGFDVQPDPNDDLLTSIQTFLNFMAAATQKGQPLTQQSQMLIGRYVGAAREMLKQRNAAQTKQADQMIMQFKQAGLQPPEQPPVTQPMAA